MNTHHRFYGLTRHKMGISGKQIFAELLRACLITLHSNFEIFLKGHPAVEVRIDRRIFER